MSAAIAHTRAPAPWQRSLRQAVTRVDELLDLLALVPEQVDADLERLESFPLRVPRAFVARMRPGDPDDPLLRQVLPRRAERASVPGFVADPLAEARVSPATGLLHKFRGRALLVATGACAVHCRYCFRRHYPYAEQRPWRDGWAEALAYLEADPTVSEVILSGGDPLAIADDRLAALAAKLAAIPHLRRLRVHTRLPIVLPERVDDALLAWLADPGHGRLRPVAVVHANHANEIDAAVRAALGRLGDAGVPVLNQAVLLAGVNDSADALCALSETLFDAGVLPYYLHLLDPVAGAAHFEPGGGEAGARALMREVAARLPGYLVPRLVREIPGAPAKVPVP